MPALTAHAKLTLHLPSLVKPYADKIKKICLQQLFASSHHGKALRAKCQSILLELCNCAGKTGCDEQLSTLLKQMLGTLGHDMNMLLASVHEGTRSVFMFDWFNHS